MELPTQWEMQNNKLVRTFEFGTFESAIDFINRVAMLATRLNHHPEIANIYNKVTLILSTHDAGDIVTDKDRELAEQINTLS